MLGAGLEENLSLAADQRKRFEQAAGDEAKGQITFGRGRIDIVLIERADLSTFLHETGHLFLNELIDDATTPGVPQQLRDDLDSLLKWMGLEVRTEQGVEAIRAAETDAERKRER